MNCYDQNLEPFTDKRIISRAFITLREEISWKLYASDIRLIAAMLSIQKIANEVLIYSNPIELAAVLVQLSKYQTAQYSTEIITHITITSDTKVKFWSSNKRTLSETFTRLWQAWAVISLSYNFTYRRTHIARMFICFSGFNTPSFLLCSSGETDKETRSERWAGVKSFEIYHINVWGVSMKISLHSNGNMDNVRFYLYYVPLRASPSRWNIDWTVLYAKESNFRVSNSKVNDGFVFSHPMIFACDDYDEPWFTLSTSLW